MNADSLMNVDFNFYVNLILANKHKYLNMYVIYILIHLNMMSLMRMDDCLIGKVRFSPFPFYFIRIIFYKIY